MVSASHVLAFAAVVTVLIAIPGPSVLFTVSRALTVARRAALLTVVGNELGLCGQVVAVAFGVGAVAERVTPVRPLRARAPAGPGAAAHLGSLFPVIALVLDSAWAAIAGTARPWRVGSRGGWR